MSLTSYIQESIVVVLCYDEGEEFRALRGLLSGTDFSPIFQEVVEEAFSFIDQYEAPPAEHTLDIFESLKERFPQSDDRFTQLYDSLQLTKEAGVNAEYVRNEVSRFKRHQRLLRSIEESISLLETQGTEAVFEVEGLLSKTVNDAIPTFDPGISTHDVEGLLALMQSEEAEVFPTGIKDLDRRELGPVRKGLHILSARKGQGKSLWLLWLARMALTGRRRVLYVTLELPAHMVWKRFLMSLYGIRKRDDQTVVHRKFKRNRKGKYRGIDSRVYDALPVWGMEQADALLRRRLPLLSRKPALFVKEFPTGGLTVRELEGYLSILESTQGFQPDLLIVDYPDLMKFEHDDTRVAIGEIYKGLRGIAGKRNIAVATVSQLNRGAAKRRVATAEDVAEDYSKGMTADVFITYNQTAAENQLGLARLFVDKGRTDEDKFSVVISQAYATSTFVVDEIGLTEDYWDDVKDRADDENQA